MFNIRIGRILRRNEKEYLLTVKDEGEKRRDDLTKIALETMPFEEPIEKVKILNFSAKISWKGTNQSAFMVSSIVCQPLPP